MSDQDDIQLVRECLRGRSAAFGQLVEKYEKLLYNTALRLVGDRDMARDITQNVFLKAYEKLDTYKPRYRFFSWIYRMTVNESLNSLRRTENRVSVDDCLLTVETTPEDELQDRQIEQVIELGLAAIPLEYRLVVVLYYFADLAYREISFILEIPEKTVKSRLHTARQLLCKTLTARGVDVQ